MKFTNRLKLTQRLNFPCYLVSSLRGEGQRCVRLGEPGGERDEQAVYLVHLLHVGAVAVHLGGRGRGRLGPPTA